jgi:hypothetical protein
MIRTSDFITINYTPDLTQTGIAYACRSLPYTYDRMGGSLLNRLRRIVTGVAVELAFRRHLNREEVPHDSLGATPFTDPDRYDIAIGGRRCDLKSFMLAQKDRIRLVRKEPHQLLAAQALVPVDQIASEHLTDDDLYVFAFLTALITPNHESLQQALDANQPATLIHALPKTWSRPEPWGSLGTLALKSDASQAVKLELGGQDTDHRFLTEQIILNPRERSQTRQDFYTLSYLYTPRLPDGILGVHSPKLKDTQLIKPIEWGNIWVYGMEIIFTGYIPRGEFRKKAVRLPVGSRIFQYTRTRTENFTLPIASLYPLKDLFERAKTWEQK